MRRRCVAQVLVVGIVAHSSAWGNEWFGGIGDWHDPANWTGGVPDATQVADVIQGEAQVNAPAVARFLQVGQSFESGTQAAVISSADISVGRDVTIARTSGGGDLTRSVSATVSLTNADLIFALEGGNRSLGIGSASTTGAANSLRSAGGTLSVVNGSVIGSEGGVGIGGAGGTGSGPNNRAVGTGLLSITDGNLVIKSLRVGGSGGTGNAVTTARGTLEVTNGDILPTRSNTFVNVGIASGTGSSRGTAHGTVTVTNGNVLLPGNRSVLAVGRSSGTGGFTGDATGVLRVTGGNMLASSVVVGITSPISQAAGRSDGRLFLTDGDIDMDQMSVAQALRGPSYGLVELIRGQIRGTSFTLGSTGDLVLGISGPIADEEYSQLLARGVVLDGDVEVRFVDGFQPQAGNVFDVVVAQNLSGSYSLSVTGFDTQSAPPMKIIQNDRRIRLRFLVPEPSTIGICAMGALLCFLRRASMWRE